MKSIIATQKRQEETSLFSDSIVGESQSTWPSAGLQGVSLPMSQPARYELHKKGIRSLVCCNISP